VRKNAYLRNEAAAYLQVWQACAAFCLCTTPQFERIDRFNKDVLSFAVKLGRQTDAARPS
jgi:hypothetical protein